MKKLFLILMCFLTFSCNKKQELPENIIPETKMAKILIDIHLLEAKIDQLDVSEDSSAFMYKVLEYDLLLNKYGIDTLTYYNSFNYYTNHVPEYLEVYDMVQDTLTKKQKLGF